MQGFEPTASASGWDRIGAVSGMLSVAVSLGAITVAILLADQFSWASNAPSDLGRAGWDSTTVFNAGLIVAGLLALPFGAVLFRGAETITHAVGAAAFLLATICLSLIGVFALPAPEHGPVAVGFFVGFTVALFVYGAGDVRSGVLARGLATVGLGVIHVLGWALWIRGGRARRGCDPRDGRLGVCFRVDAWNRGPTPIGVRIRVDPDRAVPPGLGETPRSRGGHRGVLALGALTDSNEQSDPPMIPDPDDYDSDREWAIAASERYISSFAAEHDLDPDTVASPDATDSLSEANLALLEQARSVRKSDPSPPTATNRMPGATTRSGSGAEDSSPDETDETTRDHEPAVSTGAVSSGSASGSTTSTATSNGSSTPSAPSSSSSATSSPSPSNDTDTTRSEGRSDADTVRVLSPNAWLVYGMLTVLAVFTPIVYYSQTSFALVDLPAVQGTVVAQLPSLPLFVVVVGSVGVFVVSAVPFLVGRYGVLNQPDAETVRQRHTSLRILAHLTALSGIAVIVTAGAFVVVTGRWPTAYGTEVFYRFFG